MDIEDIGMWGLAIMGYLLAGGLIYGGYWATEKAPFTIQEINCYDRFGNEILDLICGEKVYGSPFIDFLSSGISILFGAFMIFFITIGIIMRLLSE